MNKIEKIRNVLLALLLTSTSSFAQNAQGGLQGIQAANTALRSYFKPLGTLIMVIGAIVGLIGALKVYGKFSQGDPDATKSMAAWGAACLFLVLAGSVLSAFFGVS